METEPRWVQLAWLGLPRLAGVWLAGSGCVCRGSHWVWLRFGWCLAGVAASGWVSLGLAGIWLVSGCGLTESRWVSLGLLAWPGLFGWVCLRLAGSSLAEVSLILANPGPSLRLLTTSRIPANPGES